jgi:hypothetical protein
LSQGREKIVNSGRTQIDSDGVSRRPSQLFFVAKESQPSSGEKKGRSIFFMPKSKESFSFGEKRGEAPSPGPRFAGPGQGASKKGALLPFSRPE